MKAIKKIRNNLLSKRAVSVLGPTLYGRYLAKFFANIPLILQVGDLRPLDNSMGNIAKRFHYRGSTFLLDCKFCDEHLKEDSFTFGLVREIYIRDCYFKWHPPAIYEGAKIVVDMGANRGAFSTLMATQAKFVVSIECQKQYVQLIRHNMRINDYKDYAIETAFIGESGLFSDSDSPRITIDELFDRYHLDKIDFLKMDIEGSEFDLFRSGEWLQRVNAISMEVHPAYGDPNSILKLMEKYGFTYKVADENLQCTNDIDNVSFLYAWKNKVGP